MQDGLRGLLYTLAVDTPSLPLHLPARAQQQRTDALFSPRARPLPLPRLLIAVPHLTLHPPSRRTLPRTSLGTSRIPQVRRRHRRRFQCHCRWVQCHLERCVGGQGVVLVSTRRLGLGFSRLGTMDRIEGDVGGTEGTRARDRAGSERTRFLRVAGSHEDTTRCGFISRRYGVADA